MEEWNNRRMVCVLVEELSMAKIKILLYLLKHGNANAYTIMRGAGTGTGHTKGVLLDLVRMDLVRQEEGKGTEILYFLTEKGRKVAEHFNIIDKLLSDRE